MYDLIVRVGWLVIGAVAGCGRLGFGSEQATGDAPIDDAASVRYAKSVTDDRPLAYWRFESTPLVVDESGRGHDGTLAGGVALGPGIAGNGVVLSAGGDFRDDGGHLAAPASAFLFDGNAPFTLEC